MALKAILLPLILKCLDCRHSQPHPLCVTLVAKPKALFPAREALYRWSYPINVKYVLYTKRGKLLTSEKENEWILTLLQSTMKGFSYFKRDTVDGTQGFTRAENKFFH